MLRERCRHLVASRRPYIGHGERNVAGREVPYEVVWLPLSEDGQSVDLLLGGLEYLDSAAKGRVL